MNNNIQSDILDKIKSFNGKALTDNLSELKKLLKQIKIYTKQEIEQNKDIFITAPDTSEFWLCQLEENQYIINAAIDHVKGIRKLIKAYKMI